MDERARHLTSGRRLAGSITWNLTGMAAPAVVGLIAIPFLVDGFGTERFGLLAIIWMGVGYFSLFDLGLGRALTKLVAERLGSGSVEGLGRLIWTALAGLGGLGLIGALALALLASPIVEHVIEVSPSLQREAVSAFRILGAGLPIVVLTAALVGLLEAHQRFAVIALIRVPLGVLTFVAPLITLQVSRSISLATSALLIGRAFAFVSYGIAASRSAPELRSLQKPGRLEFRELLSFGGWLTVSNVVGPLMTYLDRFFIGAFVSLTAVTYYVTPYEVLSRLQIFPQSVVAVAFPALSTTYSSDRIRMAFLYRSTARTLGAVMLPLTAGLFLFAPELLELWLGTEFRERSTAVARWLAVGWTINVFARPPLTALQSMGRPDIVAKIHLAELVPFLAMLFFLTSRHGIVGAAIAWSLRVVIDALVLNELAGRQLADLRRTVGQSRVVIGLLLVGFAAASLLGSPILRGALLATVTISAAALLLPLVRAIFSGPKSRPSG